MGGDHKDGGESDKERIRNVTEEKETKWIFWRLGVWVGSRKDRKTKSERRDLLN